MFTNSGLQDGVTNLVLGFAGNADIKVFPIKSDIAESATRTFADLDAATEGVGQTASAVFGDSSPVVVGDVCRMEGQVFNVTVTSGSRTFYGWATLNPVSNQCLTYKRFPAPIVVPAGVAFSFVPTLFIQRPAA